MGNMFYVRYISIKLKKTLCETTWPRATDAGLNESHWRTACLYILMIAIHNWHWVSKDWKVRWDCMHISSDLSLFTSVISLFSASSIFSKYACFEKTWLCYMQTTKVQTILHIEWLCYSPSGKLNGQSCSMHSFNILTTCTLCSWAG